MPVFTSSIEVTADYPTIKPSLNLNFARSRALDPRITFTRASVATYVSRDGLIKYAGVDEPRFDHDPDTLESLGLLTEESRTNIFRNSDFSGGTTDWTIGSWDTNNLSFGTENVVLPTGETGPAWYVERTGNSSSAHWHQNYHSYPTNTRVAWSVWGKGEGAFNMRRLSGWTVISTNASDYGDPNNSTAFTLSPTEWRRFVVIMDASSSVGYPYFASESQTQGVRCHYWGAQIEVGNFVSSFIKSPTGSGATRAADRARITGTSFSDFFNTEEGTLVVQGRTAAGDSLNYTNQPVISIHNGSTTNRIIMFDRDNATLEWNVVDGSSANGSGVLLDETTSYTGVNDYIMCGTYENGAPTRAVANGLGADGTTIESSGKNDTVNIFNQMDIGNELGTRQCSSPIKQIRYYPLSLSDDQIKTLVK